MNSLQSESSRARFRSNVIHTQRVTDGTNRPRNTGTTSSTTNPRPAITNHPRINPRLSGDIPRTRVSNASINQSHSQNRPPTGSPRTSTVTQQSSHTRQSSILSNTPKPRTNVQSLARTTNQNPSRRSTTINSSTPSNQTEPPQPHRPQVRRQITANATNSSSNPRLSNTMPVNRHQPPNLQPQGPTPSYRNQHILEPRNRPSQRPPSDNVGNTQVPQVLIRASASNTLPSQESSISNNGHRITANQSTHSIRVPIMTPTNTNQSNRNHTSSSNQSNNESLRNNNETTSRNRPILPQNNTTSPAPRHQPEVTAQRTVNREQPVQQQQTRGEIGQVYPNNQAAQDDEPLGIFEELFELLDNFPLNLVPLLPMMFESSFGSILASAIPLYLAQVERRQLIQAIDESMREAAKPKPEPPKKVKLISHTIDSQDTVNGRQCAICISDFEVGEKTVMLKCGHFFHKDCLMPWFLEHHTCPTCRENIDEGDLQ